jgi:hypothetical protein
MLQGFWVELSLSQKGKPRKAMRVMYSVSCPAAVTTLPGSYSPIPPKSVFRNRHDFECRIGRPSVLLYCGLIHAVPFSALAIQGIQSTLGILRNRESWSLKQPSWSFKRFHKTSCGRFLAVTFENPAQVMLLLFSLVGFQMFS